MNPGVLSPNPFVAGGMLENPQLFVGRKDELRTIVSRMSGVQPTSVNVVGERRIGKSSLLYYFFQTWEQLVPNPSHYVVIYLSLQSVSCQREEDFYLAVAQELLSRPVVQTKPILTNALEVRPLNRMAFSAAMAQFENQGLLPVLCLDDFKTLFEYPQEFNNGFYNNLRSLMDSNKLMLVIASRKELDFYSRRHQLTSSFFNLGHVLKLGEFTTEEVKDLVRLPASTVTNTQAALSIDEQRLTQQLGGHHPFWLQLAGFLVCEARQLGKNKNWVKKRFAQQSRRSPHSWMGLHSLWFGLRWLVCDLPLYLGRLAKCIGENRDDFQNRIFGTGILIGLFVVIGFVVVFCKNPQNAVDLLDTFLDFLERFNL